MRSKLSPSIQKAICESLKNGNYGYVAAEAAGITERTYYNWLRRGEDGEEPFFQFFQAVKRAEAQGKERLVRIVRLAAKTSWQAAMTILERRHPCRWARRDEPPHRPPKLEPDYDLQHLSLEQFEELSALQERTLEIMRSAQIPPPGASQGHAKAAATT